MALLINFENQKLTNLLLKDKKRHIGESHCININLGCNYI